ncbi:MAG: ABC transporter ATP-binding protein [Phormidesmis sp.]
MSPLIQFRQVTKIYGAGNTEVRALWNVDMTIDAGEYCAIMGPSGSGKSTAMNMVGCLDQPTRGNYLFDGEDVARLAEDDLAHIRNRKIGFVFQQFHLLSHLSALENVEQPMMYAGIPGAERKERAAEALDQVGLGNRLGNRPNQLSGGQQQRVAIARAIVNRPLLLLADEPTGALDSQTTQDVIDIFSTLNASGITVVMVTHEPEVARLTNRVIWFRDGEVVNHNLGPDDLSGVIARPSAAAVSS